MRSPYLSETERRSWLAYLLTGSIEPGMTILRDHPGTKARVEAINSIAPARSGPPLLDAAEWAALKRICG